MQRDLLAAAQEAMRTMEELKQARQESDRIRSQFTVTQDSDGRNRWPERPPGIEHLAELRQAQANEREKSEAHEQAIKAWRNL